LAEAEQVSQGALADAQKILAEREIILNLPKAVPAEYPVTEVSPAPCNFACPASVNAKGYVGLIAVGRFQEALEVVREENPLPGICGRVCTHPCEKECRRGEEDEPIAIRALKRFVADYELRVGRVKASPVAKTKGKKVAIVGSGPAGLTTAYYLAKWGYGATIFEALPVAGGMLSVGIPNYRLPKDIVKTEIEIIQELGVEIKLNTPIGQDLTIDDLMTTEGFSAVFIGTGAHKGLKLGIPGEEDYQGFIDCVDFLRKVSLGEMGKPGNKVIVIGGGNSAVDSARTAFRLGCKEVSILYRRSRNEMPAAGEEIEDTEFEGIKIHYLAAPVKILGKDGKVAGMECVKMELGEPDASGRRRPVPIKGSEFTIEADVIIPAISQEPDFSFLPGDHKFEISRWNSLVVDPETLATSIPGVYAGGDVVSGPATVIEAIAGGKRAAKAIARYLQGKAGVEEEAQAAGPGEAEVRAGVIEKKNRIRMPKLSLEQRKGNFNEVELSYTDEQVMEEAKRCLRCGYCRDCYQCIGTCSKKVVVISAPTEAELEGVTKMLLKVPADPSKQFVEAGSDLLKSIASSEDCFISWPEKEGDPSRQRKLLIRIEPVTSTVDKDLCIACGLCETVCEYNAAKIVETDQGRKSVIYTNLCKGCGTCGASCPMRAITTVGFSDEQIIKELEASE
jgi:NADPH-dependent glutamate synthase beta subunit-like oxidoreductase/ferredoxin